MKTPEDIAKQIAAANGIDRLDMRGNDSLDFIEISRQSLLDMLVQAVGEGLALADSEDDDEWTDEVWEDINNPEACPECGCKPGDEYTPNCDTCQQTQATLLADAYGPNATKPPQ